MTYLIPLIILAAAAGLRVISIIASRKREAEIRATWRADVDAQRAALDNTIREMRTPLNAIIGYSETLKENAAHRSPAEITADLEKITEAGKHLRSLINDIRPEGAPPHA
jgi:signal transduction histidine kinase